MKKSQLPIVFGLGISALLTLTFLLFAAFGLHTNPVFSVLNGLLMAVGMFMCLKAYKDETKVYTTLVEGKVAINNETFKEVLKVNEQSVLSNVNGEIKIKTVNKSH